MATRYLSVDFGSGATGLTPAITIYNLAGAQHTARSTAGITELDSTGIYAGSINVSPNEDVYVVWDDGEATKTYAIARSQPDSNMIAETNNKIRTILNTIKNQADFAGEMNLRLAKMNDMQLNPDQIGQAFSDTMKSFNFDETLKDSKLELSKLQDSNIKLIDQVIGGGAGGARMRDEIRGLIKDLSPQMDDNTKQLTDAVSKLGTALSSFLKDDVQQNIVTAINGLQTKTGQALKLIGSEVQKDIMTPIVESGEKGFAQQQSFLSEMSKMFAELRDRFDRFDGANEMRAEIANVSSQFNTQLSSIHTIFDSLGRLSEEVRSLEDQINQLKISMGHGLKVIDGKMDITNKLRVLPQFRGLK